MSPAAPHTPSPSVLKVVFWPVAQATSGTDLLLLGICLPGCTKCTCR